MGASAGEAIVVASQHQHADPVEHASCGTRQADCRDCRMTAACMIFVLVLLRHKFLRPRTIARVLQYGHRDKSFTSASMIRMRMVAIESGMCRSGRKGGSSGSVTVGKGRFLEESGGTRS